MTQVVLQVQCSDQLGGVVCDMTHFQLDCSCSIGPEGAVSIGPDGAVCPDGADSWCRPQQGQNQEAAVVRGQMNWLSGKIAAVI